MQLYFILSWVYARKNQRHHIIEIPATPMFTVALLIVPKFQHQSRCSSMDEWVKKIWFIYTLEHNLILLFVGQ
jgi:hypothetical protein